MDLGSKHVKDLKAQAQIEITTPQKDHSLPALEASQEGLQSGKASTQHPAVTPITLLPKIQKTETPQTKHL